MMQFEYYKMSLVFLIKGASHKLKDGSLPIFFRVRYKRKKYDQRIKNCTIQPEHVPLWNAKLMRFAVKNFAVNDVLDGLTEKFHSLIYMCREQNVKPDLILIKNALSQYSASFKSSPIESFLKSYYEKSIDTNRLRKNTKNSYWKSINYFIQFLKSEKLDELGLMEFDKKYANAFADYLVSDKRGGNYKALCPSSALTVIGKVKAIFERAVSDRLIQSNPWKGLRIRATKVVKPRLTFSEIQDLLALKIIPLCKLDWARDWLLFSIYTGLAYADIASLKKHKLEHTMDGLFLDTYRVKTSEQIRQYLISPAAAIVEKYRHFGCTLNEKSVLTQIGITHLNNQLKVLAKLAGIQTNLTIHIGRHSCMQHLVESGIENQLIVNSIMGWSSSKLISANYFIITQTKLLQANKLYEDYFNSHQAPANPIPLLPNAQNFINNYKIINK
jgi:site-specific recombinase XerD